MRYIRRPRQRRDGDWIGRLDVSGGANLFVPDPTAALAAAEGKLAKPPSSVPDHACGHRLLGCRNIDQTRPAGHRRMWTRAGAGSKPCHRAHAFIGLGKIFVGRAEETDCRGLTPQPERYQCPYMEEFCRLCEDASRQVMTAQSRGFDERSKSAEIIWSHTLNLAAARAQLGRLDEARSSAKAGLAVNPTFTVSRTHSAWTAMSDDTTYLAQVSGAFSEVSARPGFLRDSALIWRQDRYFAQTHCSATMSARPLQRSPT